MSGMIYFKFLLLRFVNIYIQSLITNSLEMEVLGSIGSGIGRFRDLRFNRDDEHNVGSNFNL